MCLSTSILILLSKISQILEILQSLAPYTYIYIYIYKNNTQVQQHLKSMPNIITSAPKISPSYIKMNTSTTTILQLQISTTPASTLIHQLLHRTPSNHYHQSPPQGHQALDISPPQQWLISKISWQLHTSRPHICLDSLQTCHHLSNCAPGKQIQQKYYLTFTLHTKLHLS